MKKTQLLDIAKNIDYDKVKFVASCSFSDFSIRITTQEPLLYKIVSQQLPFLNKKKEALNPDIVDIFLAYTSKSIQIPNTFNKIADDLRHSELFQYYKMRNKIIYTNNDSFLIGEPSKGKFFIFITRTNKLYTSFFSISLILFLKFKGFFALHSALLSKENVGILLAGNSGSGKTTLVIKLAGIDFKYICDDICLVYKMNSKRVGAFAMSKVIFPVPIKKNYNFCSSPSLKSNFKEYKRLSSISIGAYTKNYFPKFLIFLQIIPSKITKIIPISKNEAMIKLIKLSQFMCSEEKGMVAEHTQLLKDLSKQCQCFNLLAGEDIKESPEKAKNILRDLIG